MPLHRYRPREPEPQDEEYELRDGLTYDVSDPGQKKTAAWRAECFIAAGFDLGDALHMAGRRDIDRVHVEALLANGATHRQVVRIVT